MGVSLSIHSATGIASVATIELESTFQENINQYIKNNYSYAPLPFDGKYYDFEDASFKPIQPEQYIREDCSIVAAADHLRDYPFLLIHLAPIFSYFNGELKGISEIPREEFGDLNEFVGAFEAAQEYPENKKEIFEKVQSNDGILIITLADLNKRPARDSIYPLIADLESRLSNELKEHIGNPEEMYPELSDRTVGRWEKSKLKDVETHIAEQMTLSEITRIIGKEDQIRSKFGYESRNQFDNDIGGLVDLRNKVMHITRSFVSSSEELDKLLDRVNRAEQIIEEHGGEVYRDNNPVDKGIYTPDPNS